MNFSARSKISGKSVVGVNDFTVEEERPINILRVNQPIGATGLRRAAISPLETRDSARTAAVSR